MRQANRETIRAFACDAHAALAGSGHPEFGEDTQMAIVDTAGDALTDAGFAFDRELLVEIARGLA